MQKEDEIVALRRRMSEIADQLESFRVRPWNFLRFLRMLRDVQCKFIAILTELIVTDKALSDALVNCATVDVAINERVDKAWQEIYAVEEKRRRMESKLKGSTDKAEGGK